VTGLHFIAADLSSFADGWLHKALDWAELEHWAAVYPADRTLEEPAPEAAVGWAGSSSVSAQPPDDGERTGQAAFPSERVPPAETLDSSNP
jgi:hypothetical protein